MNKLDTLGRLLTMGLCCAALTACAATPMTYYVDSAAGRDDASGTSMESGKNGPFKTLAKVSKLKLAPGDQVLLKCGQTFEGPLRIKVSDVGNEGSLKLGAYGSNCATPASYPIITGAKSLPIGTRLPSGLTQWNVNTPISHLLVNGKVVPAARYPARGYQVWGKKGDEADGAAALRTLVPPDKDLSGARAWVRTQDWYLEERRITGKGNALALDKKFEYPIRKGVGIYLTGKPWMIGNEVSWAYDEDTRKLTARLPDQVHDVSIVAEEGLVEIEGRGDVSISRWHLVDAGGNAVYIHLDQAFAQIKDSVIERAGRNGVHIAGAMHAVVDNNVITDVGVDGILFTEGRRVFARGNVVRRAGLWGHPKSALAAINAHRTAKADIENNLIDGAAYVGIRFSGDARINRNIVLQSCQVLSDCGAIYTWRRDVNHVEPTCDVAHNTVIGVNGDTSVRYSEVDFFTGIYLDDFTRDVNVVDNVVVDSAQGIFVHNALHNKVIGNKVIGTRNETWQILVGIDKQRFPASERLDNDIRDNELIPRLPAYKLQSDISPQTPQRIGLLDAGSRKIAIGWANWNSVDWAKISPGCSPMGSFRARLPSETDEQPTAIVLDCIAYKP